MAELSVEIAILHSLYRLRKDLRVEELLGVELSGWSCDDYRDSGCRMELG